MSIFQLTTAGLIVLVVMFTLVFVLVGVVTLGPLLVVWLLTYINLSLVQASLLVTLAVTVIALNQFANHYLNFITKTRVYIFIAALAPILMLAFVFVAWLITLFLPLEYWATILMVIGPGAVISYKIMTHFSGIIYDFLDEW